MSGPNSAASEDATDRAAGDWRARIGRPSGERDMALLGEGPAPVEAARPPGPAVPPARVRAEQGTGHVRLDWEPVVGALGYLVHRAGSPDGPFEPVDHGGGDVLAVPAPPYADTTLPPGVPAWYAVATWTEAGPGALSAPLAAAAGAGPSGRVTVEADAAAPAGPLGPVWRMLGSEHLSLLCAEPDGGWLGGADVAAELAEALRIARDELGCEVVRAHGAPCCRRWWPTGRASRPTSPAWTRPTIGCSAWACGRWWSCPSCRRRWPPTPTPPSSATGRSSRRRPTGRRGAGCAATWPPTWSGATASTRWPPGRSRCGTRRTWRCSGPAARRSTSGCTTRRRGRSRRSTGGCGSAARGRRGPSGSATCSRTPAGPAARSTSSPPTPTATSPGDLRPLTRAWAAEPPGDGRVAPPVWWTEWGVTPTHFAPVNDAVFGAPFVLRGVKAALASADALAYWVVSDHFEELGRPPALFHGGFGLLTVGNLRKPRFWALALLGRLGPERLEVGVAGDGGGGLVDALAVRDLDGTVAVLAWNGTLDQGKVDGDPLLDRTVTVRVAGLPPGSWRRTVHRVDAAHGNVVAAWRELGAPAWPDEAGWRAVRAAATLEPAEPPLDLPAPDGTVEVELDLPMPGVALVHLAPVRPGRP